MSTNTQIQAYTHVDSPTADFGICNVCDVCDRSCTHTHERLSDLHRRLCIRVHERQSGTQTNIPTHTFTQSHMNAPKSSARRECESSIAVVITFSLAGRLNQYKFSFRWYRHEFCAPRARALHTHTQSEQFSLKNSIIPCGEVQSVDSSDKRKKTPPVGRSSTYWDLSVKNYAIAKIKCNIFVSTQQQHTIHIQIGHWMLMRNLK